MKRYFGEICACPSSGNGQVKTPASEATFCVCTSRNAHLTFLFMHPAIVVSPCTYTFLCIYNGRPGCTRVGDFVKFIIILVHRKFRRICIMYGREHRIENLTIILVLL